MTFPQFRISEKIQALKPIIQGGMAIKVTRAKLAAAVANCGGVGVIAASGMTEEELRQQIREAKSLLENKLGVLGVNIMFAAREFQKLVRISMEEGIDVVIFGAGFSRDIFEAGREHDIPIIPIVSSPKLAVIATKLGASTIIVESGEAGGHLGTDLPIRELIPNIRGAVDKVKSKFTDKVSIVAAGGVTSGKDIMEMLSLGANAVQVATRFVLSKECDVHDDFKQVYLDAKQEDIELIHSPVGLPARAIRTPLVERLISGTVEAPKICHNCLKACSHKFCIMKALEDARNGDVENGLFFTGGNLMKYRDILSVKDIFDRFEQEAKRFINSKVTV